VFSQSKSITGRINTSDVKAPSSTKYLSRSIKISLCVHWSCDTVSWQHSAGDIGCSKVVMANVLILCPGWVRNGTIFLVYAYSLAYNIQYVTERGEGLLEYRGYGGKFKFLTFWCFVSWQCLCGSVSRECCVDLVGCYESRCKPTCVITIPGVVKSELGCFLRLFQGTLRVLVMHTLALIVIWVWTLNGITVQSGMFTSPHIKCTV